MPDYIPLYPWMKVKEALCYYNDMFPDFSIKKAEDLCTQLKVDISSPIRSLSKGLKERLMILLTFSRKTKVYLLDEPIGGIDPVTKDIILKTILSHVEEDSIILLSTHLIKDTEKLLDEVLFLKEGNVIIQKSCDSIREEHGKSIEEYYLEVMKND